MAAFPIMTVDMAISVACNLCSVNISLKSTSSFKILNVLGAGDLAGMWNAFMSVYENPSPTSRFHDYQKVRNVQLGADQSFETILQGSASGLSDLFRLSPSNMTAHHVTKEMSTMALIPANHTLYSQLPRSASTNSQK
jgi:hypothetical protein